MTKPIDRAALKAQARELLQTAQVSPKGMTALYCICLFLFSLMEALFPGPELVSTFLSILTTLAGWILAAGFALYCMDIRRRERSEYAVLFDGFSFTGKIIALNIVINLFVFLWSMLFVVPGIIAYYRYRFALYNLYENPDMDIMEALNLSKRQTQGYKYGVVQAGSQLYGMDPAEYTSQSLFYESGDLDPWVQRYGPLCGPRRSHASVADPDSLRLRLCAVHLLPAQLPVRPACLFRCRQGRYAGVPLPAVRFLRRPGQFLSFLSNHSAPAGSPLPGRFLPIPFWRCRYADLPHGGAGFSPPL